MYRVTDQTGRRFIITGANSGTGKEATKRIAAAGGSVIMAVRSPARGEAALREIHQSVPGADLQLRALDLASLTSVREFVRGIIDDQLGVDTLINNAGVMFPPTRTETEDGFELQFASNFLGPFALTMGLLPRLLDSPSPRVATMSSGAAHRADIRFDDLQYSQPYRTHAAYGQSKLADLLMGVQLAKIAAERGWSLLSTLAHPGYTRTNLQLSGPNLGRARQRTLFRGDHTLLPSQSVEQGAEPLLFAATDPAAEQGAYYGPSRWFGLVGPATRLDLPRPARRPDLAASLWSVAEHLTGASLPEPATTLTP